MNRKKKKNIKKMIAIFIILIALFFLLMYLLKDDRTFSKTEMFLKDVITNIEKSFVYPFYQNRKAKETDQSQSEMIQRTLNDTLKKEIQELKDMLELNQTLTDYDIINATTLSRNPNYWFQTLTIDKGKKDQLEEDMIVITKYGLIGKLSKVSNTTSEVKLITTNDANYKISVEVVTENGNIPALLNGYDEQDNTVIITGIDNHTDIEAGQDIITSGLGGVFPRGIYIGQVQQIESEKYDISKNLKVKLLQDFNNIHYVSILKRKQT